MGLSQWVYVRDDMSKELKIMSRSDQSRYVAFCTVPFYIFRIKMKIILGLAIICISFHSIVCPPVNPQPAEGGSKEDDQVHTFLYTCSVSSQCSQFLLLK